MLNLDFDSAIILEDEVVKLSPLLEEDYDNLLHFALEEPELWRYSLTSAAGAVAMKNYIRAAITRRKEGYEYPFIVFDKRRNRYAGSTRFYDIQLHQDTVQLGYTWYGKEYHGSGLNTHCKFLLLRYAFENMQAQRVEFRADFENKRSIAAMKSIGCIEEGILRSNLYKTDGLRRDSIVLSILTNEWTNIIKTALEKKLSL